MRATHTRVVFSLLHFHMMAQRRAAELERSCSYLFLLFFFLFFFLLLILSLPFSPSFRVVSCQLRMSPLKGETADEKSDRGAQGLRKNEKNEKKKITCRRPRVRGSQAVFRVEPSGLEIRNKGGGEERQGEREYSRGKNTLGAAAGEGGSAPCFPFFSYTFSKKLYTHKR